MSKSRKQGRRAAANRRRSGARQQTDARARRLRLAVAGIALLSLAAVVAIVVPRLGRNRRFVVTVAASAGAQVSERGGSAPVPVSGRAMSGAAAVITGVLEEAGRLPADDETLAVRLRRSSAPDEAGGMAAAGGRGAPDAVLREAGPVTGVHEILATDPYLLLVDQRAAVEPDPRGTLDDLLAALRRAPEADGSPELVAVPLAVAGDVPADFAAFVVYLAGELLPPEELESLLQALAAPPAARDAADTAAGDERDEGDEGDDSADDPTAELLEVLAPVVAWIGEQRAAGILAENWTDWDAVARDDALRSGGAAVTFAPRSVLKGMDRQERFNLVLARPPAAAGRLDFRLVGSALSLEEGSGPRADVTRPAISLLHEPGVQRAVEQSTLASPVSLEEAPIDIEHRDTVRWFSNAARYVALNERVVAHPLFEDLHRRLR